MCSFPMQGHHKTEHMQQMPHLYPGVGETADGGEERGRVGLGLTLLLETALSHIYFFNITQTPINFIGLIS